MTSFDMPNSQGSGDPKGIEEYESGNSLRGTISIGGFPQPARLSGDEPFSESYGSPATAVIGTDTIYLTPITAQSRIVGESGRTYRLRISDAAYREQLITKIDFDEPHTVALSRPQGQLVLVVSRQGRVDWEFTEAEGVEAANVAVDEAPQLAGAVPQESGPQIIHAFNLQENGTYEFGRLNPGTAQTTGSGQQTIFDVKGPMMTGGISQADADRLSRPHFAIDVAGGQFVLRDISSHWGTYVNGDKRIGQEYHIDWTLKEGDSITIPGVPVEFIFRAGGQLEMHRTDTPFMPPVAESVEPVETLGNTYNVANQGTYYFGKAPQGAPSSVTINSLGHDLQQLGVADSIIGAVSRTHFAVGNNSGMLRIWDLGSTNGTLIDGQRVGDNNSPRVLNAGDEIVIASSEERGKVKFVVKEGLTLQLVYIAPAGKKN